MKHSIYNFISVKLLFKIIKTGYSCIFKHFITNITKGIVYELQKIIKQS